MSHRALIVPLVALALVACDRSGDGTSISINADGGNVLGAIDGKSGEMKIDVPGFKGAITMPKIKLNAENFDIDGVHLYPGSTIEGMNIAGDSGKDGKGGVRVSFTSPGNADTVRNWFVDRLGKAGGTYRVEGQSIVGKTKDDEAFRMDIAGVGSDRARGTIVVGE